MAKVTISLAAGEALLAGCAGDRGGFGVRLQRPGVGEPRPVVAQLCEHAGAKHGPQAQEAEQDLAVGVLVKGGWAASARSSAASQVASSCLSSARSWWPKASSTPGSWWAYSARKASRSRSASASQPRRRPLRAALLAFQGNQGGLNRVDARVILTVTVMAWASSESGGRSGWACMSVRRVFARTRTRASPESDFYGLTPWR